MRFQNKTIDNLKRRVEADEITQGECEIRTLYFGLGYDHGHEEGFDEGCDEDGQYTKGYDTGVKEAWAQIKDCVNHALNK